jgi:GLPGLI family protein
MGKSFLVKDSLPSLKWKWKREVIGGYTCYKLPLLRRQVTDFRNFRPKKKKLKRVGAKADDKSASDKKTNFMDAIELPKEVTITAWYTQKFLLVKDQKDIGVCLD